MKKLGVMAVVFALVGVASAAIVPEGALKLTVYEDGTAVISNVSGVSVATDAWEIWSLGANLDNVGWYSIAEHIANFDYAGVGVLGGGAFSFGDLTSSPSLIAEGTLSGAGAVFGPTTIWSLGHAVDMPGVPQGDIAFYYSKATTPGNKYIGVVEIIPEPATMGLLAIGGLGLIARRRR